MCNVCGDTRHERKLSRRHFVGAGAVAAIAPLLVRNVVADDGHAAGTAQVPNAIAPAEALKRLMEGNARYAANAPNQRDFSAGRAARAEAQYPIAAILGCADSRVAPELAFDQGLGDLFVVRVAGNIVNTDLLASLEYGVKFLGAPLIMVLGHTGCGAVDAAIKVLKNKTVLPGHLPELVSAIKPAVLDAEKTKTGDLLTNAVTENVEHQVVLLKNAQPVVKKLYTERKIDIVGAVYDLRTGLITLTD